MEKRTRAEQRFGVGRDVDGAAPELFSGRDCADRSFNKLFKPGTAPIRMTSCLINITRQGRHVALIATHDDAFVQTIRETLPAKGYELQIDTTPSPLNKRAS